MKKILTLFIILMLGIMPSYAKDKNNHSIKFNGEKYTLLYSTKNPEFGGYINEYYKRGETYNIWTEMIGVHHFPNAYSPIDQIVEFRKYLNSENCPSSMYFDEDKNIGIIDFIMISENHAPVIMEFNVFKYTKSDKCGSVAIQYAKRYAVKNAFEAEEVKKEFAKTRKNALKNVSKMEVPAIVAEEIDKCGGGNKKVEESNVTEKQETTKEEPATENENAITEDVEAVEEQTATTTEDIKEEPAENEVKKASDTPAKQEEIKKEIVEEHAPVPAEKVNKEKPATEKKKENVSKQKEEKPVAEKKKIDKEINQKNEKSVVEKKNNKAATKKKKNKKYKENPYRVENTKDQYYAQPRDYKEIVAECKRLQKELKKQKKLEKKRAKKAAKNLEGKD
ncbi:hypothetical protein IKQ21_01920 [bacterium]|nr:hypothetical protein [bacterium]